MSTYTYEYRDPRTGHPVQLVREYSDRPPPYLALKVAVGLPPEVPGRRPTRLAEVAAYEEQVVTAWLVDGPAEEIARLRRDDLSYVYRPPALAGRLQPWDPNVWERAREIAEETGTRTDDVFDALLAAPEQVVRASITTFLARGGYRSTFGRERPSVAGVTRMVMSVAHSVAEGQGARHP